MEIEEMKRVHEQGLLLSYEEQDALIDYIDEDAAWHDEARRAEQRHGEARLGMDFIAAGEHPPWVSCGGRDIL